MLDSCILCCSVDSIYAVRVGHVHRARYTQTNNYQQNPMSVVQKSLSSAPSPFQATCTVCRDSAVERVSDGPAPLLAPGMTSRDDQFGLGILLTSKSAIPSPAAMVHFSALAFLGAHKCNEFTKIDAIQVTKSWKSVDPTDRESL
jgi:hypothetical protein